MSRVWLITGGSRGLGGAVAEATPAPRQHVFVLASVSMRHRKHPGGCGWSWRNCRVGQSRIAQSCAQVSASRTHA
jgi:NAD(P)-dependent dehydrogenase (short-subunit alcohol dehydrogenase family)